ncbi:MULTISPECIES: mycofactocin biosynthesis glycosyltransferase MftF [Tsukamurella]|uniref:Mycofactocin system glycosyltransferase n=2 Tax=Tsukamurella TaxID=2060 RepID=A0A5C5S650_9ACTN|nr:MULTISPECIES: mycofactocin biosynthesis glycosyltransferase MftF [Tsukamurella]NMD57441.1 mycofactocin system glycosyltransferase [Tsukamurella columbiensis]TWS29955.1 mycofactocin system glycosyltransferase [Tsukamurella conjunctivitidis]
MTAPESAVLPRGFTVRLDPACLRPGPRHLLGGSPMRLLTLSPAAVDLIDRAGTVTVDDAATARLARRLLDSGVAAPVPAAQNGTGDITVVVPVRDDQAGVDRLLRAVRGLPVVVVDDGSAVPIRVPDDPAVRLLRLPENRGPAHARNRGAALADTGLVAFLDADTVPRPGWADVLRARFADPTVAVAAPRIVGLEDAPWTRPVARYAGLHSSLDLGPRPGAARPGNPVAYVPSAAMLVRRGAFEAIGGFDPDLRVAEDVDLCWRLADAGWTVRYEPAARVGHDHRTTARALLNRRRFYGTGASELAHRHGPHAAPVVTSIPSALAAAGVLSGTRVGAAGAVATYAWMFARLRGRLGQVPGADAVAARIVARAAWFGVHQGLAALLRHYWPATAAAALLSRRVRCRVVIAAAVEPVVTWVAAVHREPLAPHPDPVTWAVLHRLDDLAYGLGVWQGALARRDLGALRPRVTG